jgi:hypothetical protein
VKAAGPTIARPGSIDTRACTVEIDVADPLELGLDDVTISRPAAAGSQGRVLAGVGDAVSAAEVDLRRVVAQFVGDLARAAR